MYFRATKRVCVTAVPATALLKDIRQGRLFKQGRLYVTIEHRRSIFISVLFVMYEHKLRQAYQLDSYFHAIAALLPRKKACRLHSLLP